MTQPGADGDRPVSSQGAVIDIWGGCLSAYVAPLGVNALSTRDRREVTVCANATVCRALPAVCGQRGAAQEPDGGRRGLRAPAGGVPACAGHRGQAWLEVHRGLPGDGTQLPGRAHSASRLGGRGGLARALLGRGPARAVVTARGLWPYAAGGDGVRHRGGGLRRRAPETAGEAAAVVWRRPGGLAAESRLLRSSPARRQSARRRACHQICVGAACGSWSVYGGGDA